ncbi:MAG: methyltransferase domain-containing protein [Chitinophagaceae bacterium]|nr:methyltransferase domain-containing protein [Oligoflexus sp.]
MVESEYIQAGNEAFRSIALALRNGFAVSDERFDRIFNKATRSLSSRHWTPLAVAIWAARLLSADAGAGKVHRILDVGCGPGKFCFAGALTTDSEYYGIEQRTHFIDEANRIRLRHDIPNSHFILGNMTDLDWNLFHAFYLYNPFLENVTRFARIDKSVPLSLEHFNTYVETVESKLALLPVGVRVVTYHGYGGTFPEGYRLTEKKSIGTHYLDLWVKESRA